MHACVCVCVYVYACVYVYTCICVQVYIQHIRVRVRVCVYVYTCIGTSRFERTHRFAYSTLFGGVQELSNIINAMCTSACIPLQHTESKALVRRLAVIAVRCRKTSRLNTLYSQFVRFQYGKT